MLLPFLHVFTWIQQVGFQGKGLEVQLKLWQVSKITLTHLTEQFLVPVDLVGKFVGVDFRHGQGDAVADDGDDDGAGDQLSEESGVERWNLHLWTTEVRKLSSIRAWKNAWDPSTRLH